MEPDDAIRVEVVFALPERQSLIAVTLPAGATVAEAIESSGIAGEFPQLDLANYQVGIWGRIVEPGRGLKDGDRIEIYRPLVIDPREARRNLAAEGKSMGRRDDEDESR